MTSITMTSISVFLPNPVPQYDRERHSTERVFGRVEIRNQSEKSASVDVAPFVGDGKRDFAIVEVQEPFQFKPSPPKKTGR